MQRNPLGKLPSFAHGALSLYETGAITRYVDRAFPGPALQPAQPSSYATTRAIACDLALRPQGQFSDFVAVSMLLNGRGAEPSTAIMNHPSALLLRQTLDSAMRDKGPRWGLGTAVKVAPKFLIADAKWFGTLAAVRDLGAHGIGVTLASDSLLAPARWSRYVARTVSSPSSKNASDFLAWLLRFGSVNPGHILYPTSDEVAWLVAAHSEALSRVFRLYTPGIESIVRLLDKARLMEDARAAGLDVPETRMPRSAREVEQSGRDVGFPLYLKPRAQVFGSVGKGAYLENPATLLDAWMDLCGQAKYLAEVLNRVPDMHLPLLQSCVSVKERIYTVDGFVDETGELYISLACVKILQRPRGSGPGIVFEHAETDPAIDRGLRDLFRATGYCGVFDAEFIESGGRRLLIDINPRFYNHMAFEIDRGLPLAWLAYLAAIGDRENLKLEIKKAAATPTQPRTYVHRLPTALLLAAQRLARSISREDQIRWRRWISKQSGCLTDPARAAGDPGPAIAEFALEAFSFLEHPRAYLRGLCRLP